jgi:predicted acetyltransferase
MINLIPASLEHKPLLAQLLELYLYDFSEYTLDDLSPQGYYHYWYLDSYWTDPERFPFLIQVGENWAGFALVRQYPNPDPLSPYPTANNLAEFFVLRKYRRQKVGKTAAYQVFDRFPGQWYVAQIPENLPAQAFWRTIIAEYTRGNYIEKSLPDWEGPVQVFVSPA